VAAASRQAAATPELGPGALKVVNKATRKLQLEVTGVDNYDWANDNRPDHEPPQGINKVILPVGGSVLAPRLVKNAFALRAPFNVEFHTLDISRTAVAGIRLKVQRLGVDYTCVEDDCYLGQRDYPQEGDYILRMVVTEDSSTEPTVLTITQKSNPTW